MTKYKIRIKNDDSNAAATVVATIIDVDCIDSGRASFVSLMATINFLIIRIPR